MKFSIRILENGFEKKIKIERDHIGYRLAIIPEGSEDLPDAINVKLPVTHSYVLEAHEKSVILDFYDDPSIISLLREKIENNLKLETLQIYEEEYDIMGINYKLSIRNYSIGLTRVSIARNTSHYGFIIKKSDGVQEGTIIYRDNFVYYYANVPYDLYLLLPEDLRGGIYLPTMMAQNLFVKLKELFTQLTSLAVREHVAEITVSETQAQKEGGEE